MKFFQLIFFNTLRRNMRMMW